jgi:hypothetical protein
MAWEKFEYEGEDDCQYQVEDGKIAVSTPWGSKEAYLQGLPPQTLARLIAAELRTEKKKVRGEQGS